MERQHIGELGEYIDTTVTIYGSVVSVRAQSKAVFLDIRDRTGAVQCFISGKSDSFETAKGLSEQSVISLTGTVKARSEQNRKEGKNGDIECVPETITVLSRAETLPFTLKKSDENIDTLFNHRPLTLRRPKDRALFSLQASIIQSFRAVSYTHLTLPTKA